jgi:hypothetical protein
MATTISSNSNNAFELLEQAKRDFWSSNIHLGEDERRQLWSQATALNSNPIDTPRSMVHQIPRTMPYSMSSLTQFPVWDPSLVHAHSF